MPNEVEITITGSDLSGPAFVSALARMKALQAAASGLRFDNLDTGLDTAVVKMGRIKEEVNGLSFGHINTSGLDSSLSVLKSRIASLGIADLADVNIPPGRIFTQLQLLKRMIGNAGISDILDVNLNEASLTKQLDKLGSITETIPVLFDVSRFPDLHDQPIDIPIKFDVGNIPDFGSIPLKDIQAIDSAIAAEDELAASVEMANAKAADTPVFWDGPVRSLEELGAAIHDDTQYFGGFGSAFSLVDTLMRGAAAYMTSSVIPGITRYGSSLRSAATIAGGIFATAAYSAVSGITRLNDNISLGLPMWESAGGWFGWLTGHIQLFGGALTQIGLPRWIAAASGLHLLTDGIIEIAATLIPATVGIGAFASAAIDSTDEIYNHFVNMDKVIDMTGQSVYPLTGAFSAMNQAAQPEVYVLLGEGLAIVNKNAGVLQTIALAAGKVMDDLGARITYAVTAGNGFGIFVRNAATDLAGWGNLVGNISGIIGNFLKIMPGYAEIILQVANNFTHLAEVLTGGGITQDLLKIGLAAHGAILYIGLLSTGSAVLISRTLPLMAAGFAAAARGLSAIGATNAATTMAGFSIAADRAATLPWGWITIAAAGIGFLVYELVNAKDATQQFFSTLNQQASATPIDKLGAVLASQVAVATKDLTAAEQNLAFAQKYLNNIVGSAPYGPATQYLLGLTIQVNDYKVGLQQIQSEQATVNSHIADAARVFGSTTAAWDALNAAGITSAQLMDKNTQHWAESLIEAQGYNSALRAVTDGTGRYAAAMNALSGPEQFLGDMLHSIQDITQAQDNLIQVVTQSESAFDTFALGDITLNTNFANTSKQAASVSNSLGHISSSASLAGAAIGGLSQGSLSLNQAFYDQIGNAQKVIDALEQQEIDTRSLTTATATLASQMLPYAGNNEAARASIVAMINDALGPQTVSLKTLDTWVKNNTTSLQGLDSIITQSTLKAGQLANVLATDLNVQFQESLLKASGATQAVNNLAAAIVHDGTSSNQYRSAREALIDDLEKAGFSAQQAKTYVDNLTTSVRSLQGKSISIDVTASGTGIVSYQTTSQGTPGFPIVKGNLKFFHSGGLIGDTLGSMGPDDQLAAVRTGEFVVNPDATKKYLPLLRRINGYSIGGYIEPLGVLSSTPASWMTGWGQGVEGSFAKDTIAAFKNQINTVQPPGGGIGIPGGSANSGYQAFEIIASKLGWGPSLLQDWVNVEMAEAGFSLTATNPSSGAYGMAQFINGPSEYYLYGGNPYTYLGQATAMANYILQRYGNPAAAWAHEESMHWYDDGGWLMPGLNLAYNGTGKPERVPNPGAYGGDTMTLEVVGGQSLFEKFMAQFIREFVRVKGGGDVQRAFGGRSKRNTS
jgi:hypothetical protein